VFAHHILKFTHLCNIGICFSWSLLHVSGYETVHTRSLLAPVSPPAILCQDCGPLILIEDPVHPRHKQSRPPLLTHSVSSRIHTTFGCYQARLQVQRIHPLALATGLYDIRRPSLESFFRRALYRAESGFATSPPTHKVAHAVDSGAAETFIKEPTRRPMNVSCQRYQRYQIFLSLNTRT
jgi:hypothetical protein